MIGKESYGQVKDQLSKVAAEPDWFNYEVEIYLYFIVKKGVEMRAKNHIVSMNKV